MSRVKLGNLNVPTPCIIVDQPLWIKAVEITKAKSTNDVCRLGGFHTVMNFIGSIGTMMKGSGLEEAFGIVNGTNTVTHIISGEAFSRAMGGHFLVETALTVSPPHPPYGGVRSYLNLKNHKKSIVYSIQNLNIPEHAQRVALPLCKV